MKIENWRDLVPVQFDKTKVFYMTRPPTEDRHIIEKSSIECNLTEDAMCDELDKLLSSFTEKSKLDFLSTKKAEVKSIRKTMRGFPNTVYKNARYYKGTAVFDAPIIVVEDENRFGIFIHPNFDNYGFMIEEDIHETV